MEKVKFTFYLSKDVVEKLEETIALWRLRKKEKLTKSKIVEKALKETLEKLNKELEK